MEYLALFFTHMGAINFNRYLKKAGIKTETMPVPRKYSSNCGIAVKFSTEKDIRELISEDMERVYLLTEGEDRLVYENEQA